MGLISKPFTFSLGATIIASEHNSDFDTIYTLVNGNIENTNISGSAAITDTKLAQLTTAGKVSGAALTSLASIPSAAGVVPVANLGTGTPTGLKFLRDDGTFNVPIINIFGRIDATPTVSASSGIASAVRNAAGDFTITLSAALGGGNYVAVANSGTDGGVSLLCTTNVNSSTTFTIFSKNLSGTKTDPGGYINFAVFG